MNKKIKFFPIAAAALLSAFSVSASMTPTMAASVSPLQIATFSGPEADALKALAPLFTKETGIKVVFTEFSYQALFTKELESVSGGKGTYDMIFMDDPWIPTFAGGNYLYPMSHFGYTPKGFAKGAIQVSEWPPAPGYNAPLGTPSSPRQFYSLPVTGNVLMFFYRKDLAKKYGINPSHWTWNDVNKLAAKVTTKNFFGYVMRGDGGNSSVADFSPILWAYGGHYFNKNWTSALDTPQGVAALTEWAHLFNKYAPPGSASFGANEVGNYLAKGQAAMGEVWPSGWANVMNQKLIGFTRVPGTMINGKLVQFPEVGVWSAGVPKNAPDANNAFKFLKWITSEKQQMIYGGNGLDVPTLTSVLLNKQLDKKWPYYVPFYDSLNVAKMRPRTPAWPFVEQALGIQIANVELGKTSPSQAMKNAAQQIDQYMKEHGLSK